MSFLPRPSVSRYQARARSAAGFFPTSGIRVAASQARAPSSRPSTSSPWSAAGRSPTAESCEVRPPTQSHIGKRASHFCRRRDLVELAAVLRHRDGVPAEVEPLAV